MASAHNHKHYSPATEHKGIMQMKWQEKFEEEMEMHTLTYVHRYSEVSIISETVLNSISNYLQMESRL